MKRCRAVPFFGADAYAGSSLCAVVFGLLLIVLNKIQVPAASNPAHDRLRLGATG